MCGEGVVGGAVLCSRGALQTEKRFTSNRLKFKDIKKLVLPNSKHKLEVTELQKTN